MLMVYAKKCTITSSQLMNSVSASIYSSHLIDCNLTWYCRHSIYNIIHKVHIHTVIWQQDTNLEPTIGSPDQAPKLICWSNLSSIISNLISLQCPLLIRMIMHIGLLCLILQKWNNTPRWGRYWFLKSFQ